MSIIAIRRYEVILSEGDEFWQVVVDSKA